MVSLLDIAPATAKVPLDGGDEIEVRGLSSQGIISLMQRFPVLLGLIGGVVPEDIGQLLGAVPEAVASVIAIGCGYPAGNAEAEEKAAGLPAHLQADLLVSIMKQTMPAGLRPFVERLRAAFGGSQPDEAQPGTASDTTSLPPSSV